jgi:hypothetical protein
MTCGLSPSEVSGCVQKGAGGYGKPLKNSSDRSSQKLFIFIS